MPNIILPLEGLRRASIGGISFNDRDFRVREANGTMTIELSRAPQTSGLGSACKLALYALGDRVAMTVGTVKTLYPTIDGAPITNDAPIPSLPGGNSKFFRFKITISRVDGGTLVYNSVELEEGGDADSAGTDMPMTIDDTTGDSLTDGIYYRRAGITNSIGAVIAALCGNQELVLCGDTLTMWTV